MILRGGVRMSDEKVEQVKTVVAVVFESVINILR